MMNGGIGVNNTLRSLSPNVKYVMNDAAVLSAVTTLDNSFGMYLPSATMDTIRVAQVVNYAGYAITPQTSTYQVNFELIILAGKWASDIYHLFC
jgi:hypothetical protein